MHLAFLPRHLPAAVLVALVTLACGPKPGGDDTGSTGTATTTSSTTAPSTNTDSTTTAQECTPGETNEGDGGCDFCVCSDAGQWECNRCAPTSGPETTFETTLATTSATSDTGATTSTTSADTGDTTATDSDTADTTSTTTGDTSTTGATGDTGGDALPNCADLGEGDPFDINTAKVVGDQLVLEVGYGGGCETHDFTLCFDGIVLDTDFIKLAVHHDAHGDACLAFVLEERAFDLTPTQSFGPSPVDIQLLGWDPALQYVF
ncbi:hypothetical protein [Nannocystis radixulma]|uniref:Myxococcus cysteine-rich repeat-containing protein n=1 Tax=Nannocystis radixulma TaxID=2995305 RepID=A0ABT5AZ70_9BACT|nr:hypothetical protein [Nannocystis radixulma]MDC0666247.1 hypothetical protein [Nannocystis radixulma]